MLACGNPVSVSITLRSMVQHFLLPMLLPDIHQHTQHAGISKDEQR